MQTHNVCDIHKSKHGHKAIVQYVGGFKPSPSRMISLSTKFPLVYLSAN
jgi:hypothetical protein